VAHILHSLIKSRRTIFAVGKHNSIVFATFALLASFYLVANLNFSEADMRSDQAFITAMVLKDRNPELYPKDMLMKSDKYYKFYMPFYRKLISTLTFFAGSPANASKVLFSLIIFVYLCIAYLFFQYLGGQWWLSLYVSLVSTVLYFTHICLLRPTMVYCSLVFLYLYLFSKWIDDRRRMYFFFFLVGLSINIHPVLGSMFGAFCLLDRLLDSIFQRKFHFGLIKEYLVFLLCFSVGAFPFIITYLRAADISVTNVDVDILNSIIKFRFSENYFNLPLGSTLFSGGIKLSTYVGYRTMLSAILYPLFYISLIILLVGKKFNKNDRLFLTLFFISIWVSPFGQFLIIKGCDYFKLPYFFINIKEGVILSSFVSLIFLFRFLNEAMKSFVKSSKSYIGRYVAPISAIIILVLLSYNLVGANRISFTNFLDVIGKREKKYYFGREAGYLEEVGMWARKNTSIDSVFHYFDPYSISAFLFRLLSLRSVTISWKDAAGYFYADKQKLVEWYGKIKDTRFGERGLGIVVINPQTGWPVTYANFVRGFRENEENSKNMMECLRNVENGCITIITIGKDVSKNGIRELLLALKKLGYHDGLKFLDKQTIIIVKGAKNSIKENYRILKGDSIRVECEYKGNVIKVVRPTKGKRYRIGIRVNGADIQSYYAMLVAKKLGADYVILQDRLKDLSPSFNNKGYFVYSTNIERLIH